MIDVLRASLEELTPAEMRIRAQEYRLVAATATTAQVRDALLSVARKLDLRAVERDPEAPELERDNAAPPRTKLRSVSIAIRDASSRTAAGRP